MECCNFQICIYIDLLNLYLSEYLKQNTDPGKQGQQLNQIQVMHEIPHLEENIFFGTILAISRYIVIPSLFALRNAQCSEFRLFLIS